MHRGGRGQWISVSSKSALFTSKVPEHPCLHRKILSQKIKIKKRRKEKKKERNLKCDEERNRERGGEHNNKMLKLLNYCTGVLNLHNLWLYPFLTILLVLKWAVLWKSIYPIPHSFFVDSKKKSGFLIRRE